MKTVSLDELRELDPCALMKLDEAITVMNGVCRAFDDMQEVTEVHVSEWETGMYLAQFPRSEWTPLVWDRENKEWL
jgi:hypothetical protein